MEWERFGICSGSVPPGPSPSSELTEPQFCLGVGVPSASSHVVPGLSHSAHPVPASLCPFQTRVITSPTELRPVELGDAGPGCWDSDFLKKGTGAAGPAMLQHIPGSRSRAHAVIRKFLFPSCSIMSTGHIACLSKFEKRIHLAYVCLFSLICLMQVGLFMDFFSPSSHNSGSTPAF